MRQRRFPKPAATAKPKPPEALCSGPGKLTIAMGIGGEHHGTDLCLDPAQAFHSPTSASIRCVADIRIGITKSADFPWRFLAAENPFVSVKPTPAAWRC